MTGDEKIVLFVVPNCPLCAEARSWLNARGITYDEQDVANNFGALRRMYKLTRQELVPVLAVSGKAAVRPTEDEAIEMCQPLSSQQ